MIRFSLALGFTSRNRDAEPVVLYAGKSFDEAKKAMKNPVDPGIVYAVAMKNPRPSKDWSRPGGAASVVEADAVIPAEADTVQEPATEEAPAAELPPVDLDLLPETKRRGKV